MKTGKPRRGPSVSERDINLLGA